MARILLVDDQPDIRRLIRATVGSAFEVLEAEDGASALGILRNRDIDLVVLDVMMPGVLDGTHVLDAIRADPKLTRTRVIMVTGRGQARDYDQCMRLGADAYFVKPFSPVRLVACIKDILAGDRAAEGSDRR